MGYQPNSRARLCADSGLRDRAGRERRGHALEETAVMTSAAEARVLRHVNQLDRLRRRLGTRIIMVAM